MKKFILYPVVIISLLLFACEPEEEEDPPSDDLRDKIENTWNCNEVSSLYGETNYSGVDIVKDENTSDLIKIYNFNHLGNNFYLKAKLSNTNLTITSQQIDGNTVNGTGSITNNYNKIDWNYYIDDGSGDIDTCTAVYTPI